MSVEVIEHIDYKGTYLMIVRVGKAFRYAYPDEEAGLNLRLQKGNMCSSPEEAVAEGKKTWDEHLESS